jgi:methylase of polypeptide subunit release factors
VQTLNEKLLEPGQSWRLWSAALSALLPPLEVVDFGCGGGEQAVVCALRGAARVIGIDIQDSALERARALAMSPAVRASELDILLGSNLVEPGNAEPGWAWLIAHHDALDQQPDQAFLLGGE